MLQSIYTHAGCDEIGHPVWTLFDVSIHTPTQGVTCLRCSSCAVSSVSIHTPTQGVTLAVAVIQIHGIVSIHTPTQGVTNIQGYRRGLVSFNPHTHAGCDSTMLVALRCVDCFNPHTHAGCDGSKVCITVLAHVSIHTPTQGVTPYDRALRPVHGVSIHTPTQGVTVIKNDLKTL